ncbi:hypothetical protein CTI12_AA538540 [Artemisia annua]|uniref:DDT domain superfamily n=1 Tax=Artemisia annua TaxID=35608 RepID=A0A2U1L2D5_ARTAN|nr:hypothetical protein CTI12_AA538540 [Artemisia annua]
MNQNDPESSPEIESHRNILRQRWELASVLNFFKVFEPVIESNMKVSAEEVETALIIPNKCLAQLHVSLLKGIPPVPRNLKDPDVWVVALSKKLVEWWPWVAEGDFPLTAAKGAEMATYKELDPTIRLVILKALCEIRADQHDVVSYINDAVKNKNELSTFRKINIGEDGKGTSYWLDGNDTFGLRLYKEVNTFKGKGTQSTISSQWETLATNLEEFQNVVEEYSSSNSKLEVAVGAAVEPEAIPVLTKLHKKKQRELQRKRNAERLIDNFCRSGITRSCRSRKPITYTFDAYDKAITEAIRETNTFSYISDRRMKTQNELRSEKKRAVANEDREQDQPIDAEPTESDSESSKHETEDVSEASAEESDESEESEREMKTRGERREKKVTLESGETTESEQEDGTESEQENGTESEQEDGESAESDSESSKLETNYVSDSEKSGEESDENDDENKQSSDNSSKENGSFVNSTKESKKITEKDDRSIQQIRNFGTKKRLRQRPNCNTALESAIAPDSEDEMSSEKY